MPGFFVVTWQTTTRFFYENATPDSQMYVMFNAIHFLTFFFSYPSQFPTKLGVFKKTLHCSMHSQLSLHAVLVLLEEY